LDISV